MQNSEARKHYEATGQRAVDAALANDKAFSEYVTIRQDLVLGRVELLVDELDALLEKWRNLQALRS